MYRAMPTMAVGDEVVATHGDDDRSPSDHTDLFLTDEGP
jgi:hypothetical protein